MIATIIITIIVIIVKELNANKEHWIENFDDETLNLFHEEEKLTIDNE